MADNSQVEDEFLDDAQDGQEGYVYLATNEAMPGLVKIGIAKDVEARMEQLSSATGVPQKFDCEFSCEVQDPAMVEYCLHQWFDYFRDNPKKEFFRVDWKVVQSVLLYLSGVEIENISNLMRDKKNPDSPVVFPKPSIQQPAPPQGNLRQSAVQRINAHLSEEFQYRNRTILFNREESKCLVCLITNVYYRQAGRYWLSVTLSQKNTIDELGLASNTWVSFACQTSDKIFLVPWQQFLNDHMPYLGVSYGDNGEPDSWHVYLAPPAQEGGPWMLCTRGEHENIPFTEFLLPPDNGQ